LSGDGRVDANEIKRLVESRGFYMTFKEADSFLKKFDKNRDGTITYNEVSIYFSDDTNQLQLSLS
jgi:Ca2+-binding EF-hand superfamily protein